MAVYLLHFDRPLEHARHYLGFTDRVDVEVRIEEHRRGQGAELTRAAVEAGINMTCVAIWPHGDRNFERSLKNRKETPRLCPVCSGKHPDPFAETDH